MDASRALAVAQTIPVRGEVEANLEDHLRCVRAAAAAGARVVVFPELSLTGYELDLAAELAFEERDRRLEPLLDAVDEVGVHVVAGAPVRIAARLHIGAFLLSPARGVELYTKRHLGAFPSGVSPNGIVPPPEPTVFEPGDRDPLLPFAGGSAALAVCADTGRPEHPQAAARRGATTYLASMFFTRGERAAEAARLGGIAARHSVVVAMANFGGPTGGLEAGGGSAIWSAAGERLVELDPEGEGVAVAIERARGWQVARVRAGPRNARGRGTLKGA